MGSEATECRHEFQCEGWTVDPRDSTCWVCGGRFVFWSEPADPLRWEPSVPATQPRIAPSNPGSRDVLSPALAESRRKR